MHKTTNLDDGYLGSGKLLHNSIRYHGKENFKREILFKFDNEEDMITKEIELVNEEFIARKDTYNITLGGKGGWKKINDLYKNPKFKEDVIKRRSETLKKRRKEDPELDLRLKKVASDSLKKAHLEGKIKYNNFKGKKHTEETKSKMRISAKDKQKGFNNSQFGTCWITNDVESKKIKRGDLIPEGWRLGRKM